MSYEDYMELLDVEIDEDTRIESHVILKGPTKIGKRNHIFQKLFFVNHQRILD